MGTEPIRATNEAARRVFTARAAFYRTSASHTDPAVLERLVEIAAPGSAWTALDLATGAGHTALALAPRLRRVVAYDLTRAMLAQAAGLSRERGADDVRLAQGDVHRLPFADGAFDLVTCRRAAHHFADLPAALAEARRVLRPEGRLVIDDRSVPDDPEVDALMNRLDVLHDPSHVRELSPRAWAGLLGTAGLTVEVVEPYERLRPLDDLTRGVDEPQAEAIRGIVETLSPAAVEAFGRRRIDGAWHIRHWYVLLAARRDS